MSITAFAVKYFGPRAAKAVLSGVQTLAGTVLGYTIGPEVIEAFQSGVSQGLAPAAQQAGLLVGAAIGSGLLFLAGHIPVYRKANKPDPKEKKDE